MFKAFKENEIVPINYVERELLSISKDSPCASHIHFLTGIRSLGNTNIFDLDTPASFSLTQKEKTRYKWSFDKTILPGTPLTAERTFGSFLTISASQIFNSSTNTGSKVSHISVFDHTNGYLYRNDNAYDSSVTSLYGASTSIPISVVRLLNIRKDIFKSSIQDSSFKVEVNLSNTSTTGVQTGAASSFMTALDLKNPYAGDVGMNIKSFFGVQWAESTSLDTATAALTIEAIIRPYKSNSVILWRRLSSPGWAGSVVESQNSFIKLELTKSPDNSNEAFRFYIRSVTANGDFAEDFAKKNVQASGLFVPSEVGVNLFDGRPHHIIVSWSNSGMEDALTTESGAGAVFGYIDGYKLNNLEQTNPRLGSADGSDGPVIQNNMFAQKIPIKVDSIFYTDTSDASPSGNNLYIGVSNFNRDKTDVTGDRGNITVSSDMKLVGGYDGQIQHIRMWNIRFADGSTGLLDDVNQKVVSSSTAGISFNNFQNHTLTAGYLSGNMIAWWNFNERNTLSADDISSYSNTGQLVGNASIDTFDSLDISISGLSVDDSSASSVVRTFLYNDVPENNIIKNKLKQGRIIRNAADGRIIQVGLIFYDLGLAVFDGIDENARMNFVYPASGSSGDFGFSVTGSNNTALNMNRMAFITNDSRGRLILKSTAEGDEFNYSNNRTAINAETNEYIIEEPTTYIHSVGLYDDFNNLLAIVKLAKPVKKDEATKIIINNRLDF